MSYLPTAGYSYISNWVLVYLADLTFLHYSRLKKETHMSIPNTLGNLGGLSTIYLSVSVVLGNLRGWVCKTI